MVCPYRKGLWTGLGGPHKRHEITSNIFVHNIGTVPYNCQPVARWFTRSHCSFDSSTPSEMLLHLCIYCPVGPRTYGEKRRTPAWLQRIILQQEIKATRHALGKRSRSYRALHPVVDYLLRTPFHDTAKSRLETEHEIRYHTNPPSHTYIYTPKKKTTQVLWRTAHTHSFVGTRPSGFKEARMPISSLGATVMYFIWQRASLVSA